MYRYAILSLYSKVTAYSCGTGDGSFLFNVLCGVKTGCPMSSVLFILCIDPFMDLFNWLSDNPGFSLTRVCADDFGSTLDQLCRIKTQASIFRRARSVAGLHCIIVISCITISDELIFAVKNWLKEDVPDFQDLSISSSGKYLGWFLGRGSVVLSFQDPLKKFVHSVHGIVAGHAPAPTAIMRYNQRAVPVLSFVSQFSGPPVNSNIPEVDQWSVHKLLRMPSNCMSRKLCHSLACLTEVDPISLSDFCSANLMRFAHSEREYLLSLYASVTIFRNACPRQDNTTLCSINAPLSRENLFDVPNGCISDPPILVNLLHVLNFPGPFSDFRHSCSVDSARSWIPGPEREPKCDGKHFKMTTRQDHPAGRSRFVLSGTHLGLLIEPTLGPKRKREKVPDQRAFLKALSVDNKVCNMGLELHEKVKITLQPFAPFDIPNVWWNDLYSILRYASPYIKLCWLKTICGAWCTSVRLHTVQGRPCVFGCRDSSDELCHYLACPILWYFIRASLRIQEESIISCLAFVFQNPLLQN